MLIISYVKWTFWSLRSKHKFKTYKQSQVWLFVCVLYVCNFLHM